MKPILEEMRLELAEVIKPHAVARLEEVELCQLRGFPNTRAGRRTGPPLAGGLHPAP